MGENPKTISVDFDKAAYLCSVDSELLKIEKRDRKTYFHFSNSPIISEELEQFKDDICLQNYVNGIAKLRKLLHDYKRQQKISLAKNTAEKSLNAAEG